MDGEGERDAYECHREALMLPRTPQAVTTTRGGAPLYADWSFGLADKATRQQLLDACMAARGYRRVR